MITSSNNEFDNNRALLTISLLLILILKSILNRRVNSRFFNQLLFRQSINKFSTNWLHCYDYHFIILANLSIRRDFVAHDLSSTIWFVNSRVRRVFFLMTRSIITLLSKFYFYRFICQFVNRIFVIFAINICFCICRYDTTIWQLNDSTKCNLTFFSNITFDITIVAFRLYDFVQTSRIFYFAKLSKAKFTILIIIVNSSWLI